MNAVFAVLGTICLLAALYIGLVLAGVMPEPYALFGGWLYGIAPTALTLLATMFFRRASEKGPAKFLTPGDNQFL